MYEATVLSIRAAVASELHAHGTPVVLAVSGGVDSMVLLNAAVAAVTAVAVRGPQLVVATFNHQSGAYSSAAARLVQQVAASYDLPMVVGCAEKSIPGEAGWRTARWTFLRGVADDCGGTIWTAHTRDDQVETVLLREMRGSGPRGLAGLYATSAVRRPLIGFDHASIRDYATALALQWAEDPTNTSPQFARNRVRHDLLPAIRRVCAGIDQDLLQLSLSAAAWRDRVDDFVSGFVPYHLDVRASELDVDARTIADLSPGFVGFAWASLAARVGAVLDRRGTNRLAAFTAHGKVGGRIPLSGGWVVYRSRTAFQIRRSPAARAASILVCPGCEAVWEGWRFQPTSTWSTDDPWTAWLPADGPLRVRAWAAGDRLATGRGHSSRKVKRLLSERGITGGSRNHWPVVLVADEIVWVPGVATAPPPAGRGRAPGLPYRCDSRHHEL